MSKNLSFQIALIVSILIHSLFLYFLPNIKAFQDKKLRISEIEVTYKKLVKTPEQKIKLPSLIDKVSPRYPKAEIKDIPFKHKKLTTMRLKQPAFKEIKIVHKKEPVLPEISLAKKKVTLPEIEQPEIKHPIYLTYYQRVREKIKHFAYNNYTKLHEGEIYISFIIDSAGSLIDIKILEEKSSDDAYLKDISLESIEDAVPYPAFPKDLDYPQLSFNVIISYEVD